MVMSTSGMEVVTRNYVEYMTSSRLLLGAEFDKVISILVVTALLAVAIVRARRLLIRSAMEGAAAEDLSRFLPSELAAQITTSENPIEVGQGELTEAAVLTCDLRSFTKFSMDKTPHTIMALLNDYQARMVAAVNRHGGVIDKFPGDGIMVMFNTVKKSPTYAADALRCADDMAREGGLWAEERISQELEPLEIVLSAASGPVLFGAVGDETRMEYTVIGDAGNVAAKLEKHTKIEGVHGLTTKATFDEACAQGYVPPGDRNVLDQCRIGGIGEPVDLVVMAE
jgi:adenylate cyclase